MRVVGKIFAGIALSAVAFAGLSTPAQAANQNVIVDCVTTALSTAPVINVTLAPGDTLTLSGTSCNGAASYIPSDSITSVVFTSLTPSGAVPGPGPWVYTVRSDVAGGVYGSPTAVLLQVSLSSFPALGQYLYVTIIGSDSTPPGTPAAGPAPVTQQVGMPASMTCSTFVDKSLNWAGVPDGGWTSSWAQWVNGGKGGAVCTRTLTYSTTQMRWVLTA